MESQKTSIAKIETFVHPAEINHVSVKDLEKSLKYLGKISRELFFLKQDFNRIEQHNKEIIYLLDFSDLYSYLSPEQSNSQYKEIVRHLLTSENIKFYLPPGAILELKYKLNKVHKSQLEGRENVKDIFSNPFFEKFFENKNLTHKDIQDYTQFPDTTIARFFESIESFINISEPVRKLHELYQTGKLNFLSSIIEVKDVEPDPEIYNMCYSELEASRPFVEKSTNSIDAHNYALAYALNNKFYESKDYFFLLVTSSRTPYSIFDKFKWQSDPHTLISKDYLMRTSLVRNTVQLLYSNFLKDEGVVPTKELGNIIKNLGFLHDDWSNIPAYKKYKMNKDKNANLYVRLPKNRKYENHLLYFRKWYSKVFRPVAEVISSNMAQEENLRSIRKIDRIESSFLYFFDESYQFANKKGNKSEIILDYRSIIHLYDRIINLTEKNIIATEQDLEKLKKRSLTEIDLKNEFLKLSKIYLQKEENNTLLCTEYNLILQDIKVKDVLFSVDVYKDYAAFWWRTNIEFIEFIRAVRYYLQSFSQQLTQRKIQITKIEKNKEFLGIYFYLDNDVKFFDAQYINASNLNSYDILELCDKSWNIIFVRIATEYGDFCYDFGPVSQFPQRAGFTTHIYAHQCITDFIQWTNIKHATKQTIFENLKVILPST